MKCLDTTFLIDFLRNEPPAVKKLLEFDEEELATTTINVFEIMLGICLAKDNAERKLNEFEKLINNLDILSFDFKSSVSSSRIVADLIKKGETIDDLDGLIAGCMLAHGSDTVVTRDAKHFSRIKGIKVENY